MFRVGTSGYVYKEWKGGFYEGRPSSRWFNLYARRFDTVELNGPFYRWPSAAAIDAWRAQAPPGFLYAVKAWKGLTHYKKLLKCEDFLPRFLDTISGLGRTLGPVLFQLPPRFRANADRLEAFLRILPRRGFRFAFEFRDPSWLDEGVYGMLRERNVAVVRTSTPEIDGPRGVFTADFGYWRLHGAETWYSGRYGPKLRAIAAEMRSSPGDAFAYFDNTGRGEAVDDALALRRILAGRRTAV